MENEAYRRFLAAGDSDRLVEALSREQFLKPHESVEDAVSAIVNELGVCPEAAAGAMEALNVQPDMRVGRVRRTELMQLARSISRFWRQAVIEETTPSHPA
jgi:ribosomal protein S13